MPKKKVNKRMILAHGTGNANLSLSSFSAQSSLSCYNADFFFWFLDSGEYECKVDTDNGKTFKESFVLTVEPKPKLKFEEECEDNTKLAKCHLIVAAKLCNKSSDLARYF